MRIFITILSLTFSLYSFAQVIFHEDGVFKEYYKDGSLKEEGFYRNNKKVGVWKKYYKSGELLNMVAFNNKGEKTNNEASYYKNGDLNTKVTSGENGARITRKYQKDTKVLVYECYNVPLGDKKEKVVFRDFYENGNVKTEAILVDRKVEGSWFQYYKSGEKHWEVNYYNGNKQGDYKEYHENGNLKLEGTNLAGLKNGKEKRYNEEGSLIYEGEYLKDALNGIWIAYDVNTRKSKVFKYKKGKSKKANIITPTEVPYWVLEDVPVYPGCENLKSLLGKKKCMVEKIATFVSNNYNIKIADDLSLQGKMRILVIFKIDKTGRPIGIRARAPHPELEEEAIAVIKKLPKMIPGKQFGQPVTVPYSLPIIFQVKERQKNKQNTRF